MRYALPVILSPRERNKGDVMQSIRFILMNHRDREYRARAINLVSQLIRQSNGKLLTHLVN